MSLNEIPNQIASAEAHKRLNILVTAPHRYETGRALEIGCSAIVRYSYSDLEWTEEKPSSVLIPAHEEYDPTARNQVGNLGAIVSYFTAADIADAVAKLRNIWGDLPVQINMYAERVR